MLDYYLHDRAGQSGGPFSTFVGGAFKSRWTFALDSHWRVSCILHRNQRRITCSGRTWRNRHQEILDRLVFPCGAAAGCHRICLWPFVGCR